MHSQATNDTHPILWNPHCCAVAHEINVLMPIKSKDLRLLKFYGIGDKDLLWITDIVEQQYMTARIVIKFQIGLK